MSNYAMIFHNVQPAKAAEVFCGDRDPWAGNGSFCVLFKTGNEEALRRLWSSCEEEVSTWDLARGKEAVKALNGYTRIPMDKIKQDIPHLMATILCIQRCFGANAPPKTGLTLSGTDLGNMEENFGAARVTEIT
jgi:hypothetical protein